jgi:hypothetical protein
MLENVEPANVDGSEIEWLDGGSGRRGNGSNSGPGRPGNRRRWWYALAALAIAALAVTAVQRHLSNSPSAQVRTSPSPSSSPDLPSSASLSAPPTGTGTGTPVTPGFSTTIFDATLQALGATSDWSLFARGPSVVTRIQPSGLVTTTSVPAVGSSGPVFFVAGPDRVLVRPLDNVSGYQVLDDPPTVQPLPGALNRGAVMLPGPDPHHVWLTSDTTSGADGAKMQLVGIDGSPTDTSIRIANNSGTPLTDGDGYLFYFDVGGAYDARPSGSKRMTTGQLLAVGPTRWLSVECDDADRCAVTVTDRADGQRRTLPTSTQVFVQYGQISPDGTTAALLMSNLSGTEVSVHLIDLTTGIDRDTQITVPISDYGNSGDGTFAWSPDNRWLFTTANGKLVAINRGTAKPVDLGLNLPPLTQVVIRPS